MTKDVEFDPGYGEDSAPPAPTAEALKEIHALVAQARKAEAEAAAAMEIAKAKAAAYESLIVEAIPAAMQKLGLQKFTTMDGVEVSLKDELTFSVSQERRPAAMQWLEENGHGSVIKNEITVSFAKGQDALARSVIDNLQSTYPGLPIAQNKNVHPQTLKALLKELMTRGVIPPQEIFLQRAFKKAVFKTG